MTVPQEPTDGYVSVADLEVDAVSPRNEGFVLKAVGADSADYLVEMHFDMPIDRRTQAVLGELLSQTEVRVWRRPRGPMRARWKRGAASQGAAPLGEGQVVLRAPVGVRVSLDAEAAVPQGPSKLPNSRDQMCVPSSE